MFNLLVKSSGWAPSRDRISRDRVFEHTPEALKQQFKPNGVLNTGALFKMPTQFMPELGRSADQVAHVGSLSRVRESGNFYALEYVYDDLIPPIANAKIAEFAAELEIDPDGWELSRTHWAVKDADLCYTLIRHGIGRRASPRVFSLSDEPVNDSLVSVMMPFASEFDAVYETLQEVAREAGKEARRADDLWKHEAIIQDVVFLLCTSSAVICDLSGHNSNVFYETGIAHTLDKDVILIAQSADDVPFNLRHLRCIIYENSAQGRQRLADQIGQRLRQVNAA